MKSGEVIQGKYRLDKRLGVGGMGEVWRATHLGTGRECAIKFMHAHIAASSLSRDRFAREARVSAQINHPSIIDVFDVGEHDEDTLYLVMELLSGMLLVDAFAGDPPLTVRDFLAVMHDVVEALGAAHAAGIIHRDIKPENIFLHRDRVSGVSVPKVLDFGIAKLEGGSEPSKTATGAVLGSPRYMSPEQSRGAAGLDGRSDLWSCGVILFEGLTGTLPYQGDSFSSLIIAINTLPPASIDAVAPSLPEAVRSIVRDCLKPVDQRVANAAELAARLALALEDPTLAHIPLARSHQADATSTLTAGMRFRSSASEPISSPIPSRALLTIPPSSGRPAVSAPSSSPSPDPGAATPLFRPVARTVPITGEAQARMQKHLAAAEEKKQPKAFVPTARTAKMDSRIFDDANRIIEAKRAAAGGPLPAPPPQSLQPQHLQQQSPQPRPQPIPMQPTLLSQSSQPHPPMQPQPSQPPRQMQPSYPAMQPQPSQPPRQMQPSYPAMQPQPSRQMQPSYPAMQPHPSHPSIPPQPSYASIPPLPSVAPGPPPIPAAPPPLGPQATLLSQVPAPAVVASAPARSGGGMRITAAVLAFTLVGLVAVLVVVLRRPVAPLPEVHAQPSGVSSAAP